MIEIYLSNNQVSITLKYRSNILSEPQAMNLVHIFVKAITEMVANPGGRIGELDLATEEDLLQISSWNGSARPRVAACVHELICHRAMLGPLSQAICSWDGNMTYEELEIHSTKLAFHLISLGIRLEVIVPLCFEKSKWTIVAMIGVLKAGAAFAPLDPTHPQSRLTGLIHDTGAKVVLSSVQNAHLFSSFEGVEVVVVNGLILAEFPKPTTAPQTTVCPDNIAYVIFTSGSTGKPKGCVVEHSAFCSSARAHGEAMQINAESRVFQFASYTFDASLAEILTTLIMGGCVCVPSGAERLENMVAAITRMKVTWMFLTPSVARLITPYDIPGVKTLVLGGEKVAEEDVHRWRQRIQLFNGYGPTECTVFAICREYTTVDTMDSRNIGATIGATGWIVSPTNLHRLSPVGAIGELVLEGPLLARGYLNDQVKTDDSFILHPAWATPNLSGTSRRVYKTGDLVRYAEDGTFEYYGRKDEQIKLHGQRIDPGEIEHCILKTFAAKDVSMAVTAKVELLQPLHWKGGNVLVAFLCFKQDEGVLLKSHGSHVPDYNGETDGFTLVIDIDTSLRSKLLAIRDKLATLLPAYMVPSLYLPLTRVPLTRSGKLDRTLLRRLGQTLSEQQLTDCALADNVKRLPQREMEKRLQMLWAAVLDIHVESIGADDTFFQHGGDSIAAIRLVNAAREVHITLSVMIIFQTPRLSEMAQDREAAAEAEVETEQPKHQAPSNIAPFALLPVSFSLAGAARIGNVAIEDAYPCTPLQEGLMALSMMHSGAYVAQYVLELPANVDIAQFQAAWQATVDANAILRTSIIQTAKYGAVQLVLGHQNINWHIRREEAESQSKYLERERARQMEHGKPLSHYALLHHKGGCLFVWTVHHALYDGWSLPCIIQQVESYYRQRRVARAQVALNNFIQHIGEVHAKSAWQEFWQAQLRGSPAHFPPRPAPATHARRTNAMAAHTYISPPHSASASHANLLRAAWALVVAEYTSSADVVFGAVLSGRSAPVVGIDKVIGPVIATVPVRVQVDAGQKLEHFLKAVQEQAVSMIPFEHIGMQNIMKVSIDAAAACQVQNLLIVHPTQETAHFLDAPLLAVNEQVFYTYPLVVDCWLGPAECRVTARYDGAVFSRDQIGRVLALYEHVVRQLGMPSSKQTVGDISMLSPRDKQQLAAWHLDIPVEVDGCVHQLFQRQVALQPDAPAICSWDQNLTYTELDELSTQLATYLRRLGVRSEAIVPICFEKSAWAVVAMLGVLKAGGACVAIDPAFPQLRREQILKSVQGTIVLTALHITELFVNTSLSIVVVSRAFIDTLPSDFQHLASFPSSSSSTAFVVFTSGSTGTPKGIVIEHRALCTSADAQGAALRLGNTSRVLQFAAYTFDVSNGDIFVTLLNGGCVCIPSEDERFNDLAGSIRRMNVNWACLTPSAAGVLHPVDVPSLEVLLLGGEALTQSAVTRWADKVHLINVYGPAECTIWCARNAGLSVTTIPANIGFGMGAWLWIVDAADHNKLCAIGSVGELLIEGPTLARGYLHNAVKTAAAFITNPAWAAHSTENGVARRFYKTGDLVHYDSDGTIIFIGRRDSQIKRHGHRIELGEIDHHLSTIALIQDAATVFPSTGPSKQRLVAVISLKSDNSMHPTTRRTPGANDLRLLDGADTHIATIRTAIAEQLPKYMLPDAWAVVETMPLTRSGKIDRMGITKWLESMDDDNETLHQINMSRTATSAKQDGVISTPNSALELQLCRILSEVFSKAPELIFMNCSFIGLGGDSLTAIHFVSACRVEGIHTTFHDLLQAQSMTDLAHQIQSQCTTLVSVPPRTHFPLSPAQHVVRAITSSISDTKDIFGAASSTVRLQLRRHVTIPALDKAIHALVQRHPILRARFRREESGKLSQLIRQTVAGSYKYRLHTSVDLDQMRSIEDESRIVLDPTKGPVFVADFVDLKSSLPVLLLTMHCLVVDPISCSFILQDLGTLLQTGTLPADKSISFAQWCQSQEAYDRLVPPDTQAMAPVSPYLEYWGMAEIFPGEVESMTKVFTLEATTSLTILGPCCDALRVAPVDIFLSAIFYSFHRIFSDRDLPLIFIQSDGREAIVPDTNMSRTVGSFMTPLPIHASLSVVDDAINLTRYLKASRGLVSSSVLHHHPLLLHGRRGMSWPMEILFNDTTKSHQIAYNDSAVLQQETVISSQFEEALERHALFHISAITCNGRIQISFTFNARMSRRSDILVWIDSCKDRLEDIARQTAEMEFNLLPSDFPSLSLTPTTCDQLKNDILPRLGIRTLKEIEDIYPCTPLQEDILISQNKELGYYEITTTQVIHPLHPSGKIDIKRLQNAWQQVVSRHPSLRTVFIPSVSRKGGFDQVVLKHNDAPISVSQEQPRRPYNHTFQPPHHLTLWQNLRGEVCFKLEISHAIIDGQSLTLLFRDWSLAYTSTLPTIPSLPYSTHVSQLQTPSQYPHKSWSESFSNISPCNILPPTPEQEGEKSSTLRYMSVPTSNTSNLRHFCQENNITLSTLFYTAWALALFHLNQDSTSASTSKSVTFGYFISGRDHTSTEAIGLYIKLLIYHPTSLSSTTSFLSLLQDVHSNCIRDFSRPSFAHSLNNTSTANGTRLFNTLVNFRKFDTNIGNNNTSGFKVIELTTSDPMPVRLSFPHFLLFKRFNYWNLLVFLRVSKIEANRV